jgi:hypothetical protein
MLYAIIYIKVKTDIKIEVCLFNTLWTGNEDFRF